LNQTSQRGILGIGMQQARKKVMQKQGNLNAILGISICALVALNLYTNIELENTNQALHEEVVLLKQRLNSLDKTSVELKSHIIEYDKQFVPNTTKLIAKN
jgi:hypothetical protein